MSSTIINSVQLYNQLESLCNKAIQTTCYRLLGTLQELIDSEYYDQFEPKFYERTYQFWKSAMTKMVKKNLGTVLMKESSMNYNEYWDGELQLQFASRGFHGTTEIQTEGRFWKSFIEFCEKNSLDILKEELTKLGLNVV